MVGTKDGPVPCQVVKVVHDDSYKEVDDLQITESRMSRLRGPSCTLATWIHFPSSATFGRSRHFQRPATCHYLKHQPLALGLLGYGHNTAPLQVEWGEPTCWLDSFPQTRLLGWATKDRGQRYPSSLPSKVPKKSMLPLGLHRHLLCPLGQCHHDNSQEWTTDMLAEVTLAQAFCPYLSVVGHSC